MDPSSHPISSFPLEPCDFIISRINKEGRIRSGENSIFPFFDFSSHSFSKLLSRVKDKKRKAYRFQVKERKEINQGVWGFTY